MPELYKDFLFITPELILLLGALFALMLGAFTKNNNFALVFCLSLIASAIAMVMAMPSEKIQLFSGVLEISELTNFAKILILLSAMVVLLFSHHQRFLFEFSILTMLSAAGMLLLVSATSLMIVYLSIELMTLPLYIMAAIHQKDSKSTEAGIKYFVLGSISSGLFLLGTSLVYGFTQTLSFAGIYEYYVALSTESEALSMPLGFLISMIFILVALCFKISAVPFHMWSPDVYQGSPTIVTTFFASAPKVAGFIITAKILLDPFTELYSQWQQILLFAAIASMLIGSVGAIAQSNFKRLLAYSSIGHVGFILCGLLIGEPEGAQATLIYLSIYISMTLGTFGVLLTFRKNGKELINISDFSGISKAHPYMSFAMAVFMLSMAGIPPLAGFIAKLYILFALIGDEFYYTSIAFILFSLISAYYYIKIIKVMYFDASTDQVTVIKNFPLKIGILACALFNILLILNPDSLITYAARASIFIFR